MTRFFLIFLGLISNANAEVVDRIAAVVNDEVITLSEVYDLGGSYIAERCGQSNTSCERAAELEILDSLVQRILIRQELSTLGLNVKGADIDRSIDQIRRDYQIADQAAFRKEIEKSGITWETYRDQLTEQLRQMAFTENILKPRVSITSDELLDLYNRSIRGVSTAPRRIIQGLSINVDDSTTTDDAVSRANEIAAQVESDQISWTEAIATYHSGFIAKEDGAMGEFKRGDLSPALDMAVFNTEVGNFTTPINLGGAVMLVKVVEELTGPKKSFEESKAELSDSIYQTKVEEEMERWYQIAKRKSSIQTLLTSPE